jgi:hypothetical protein
VRQRCRNTDAVRRAIARPSFSPCRRCRIADYGNERSTSYARRLTSENEPAGESGGTGKPRRKGPGKRVKSGREAPASLCFGPVLASKGAAHFIAGTVGKHATWKHTAQWRHAELAGTFGRQLIAFGRYWMFQLSMNRPLLPGAHTMGRSY